MMYELKNTTTGVVHKIDDDAFQELAACLQYARDKDRQTVMFRSMRLDADTAAKIIHDLILQRQNPRACLKNLQASTDSNLRK